MVLCIHSSIAECFDALDRYEGRDFSSWSYFIVKWDQKDGHEQYALIEDSDVPFGRTVVEAYYQ